MADQAMSGKLTNPATLDVLGAVYSSLNAHDAALKAFREAAARTPDSAPIRFNLATSLIGAGAGAVDEAEREIDTCLSLNPHFWRAHLALAYLREQTPLTHHLDATGIPARQPLALRRRTDKSSPCVGERT